MNPDIFAGRVDYALTVQRLQEKLVNKKSKEASEKLEEVALSEEIVKTNEAKLLAMKREKAAQEAELEARKKEEEAKVCKTGISA